MECSDVPTTNGEVEAFLTVFRHWNNCLAMGISRHEFLVLGDDCIFSYDTVLYNTDGHPIYAIDGDEPLNRAHQIKLGKRIWVAHSVVVLKNVELGNNLILGRGALINKSCLQDNCVLAGMPARVVKENVRWELPFPAVGEKSKFKGRAAPDIVMPKPTKP